MYVNLISGEDLSQLTPFRNDRDRTRSWFSSIHVHYSNAWLDISPVSYIFTPKRIHTLILQHCLFLLLCFFLHERGYVNFTWPRSSHSRVWDTRRPMTIKINTREQMVWLKTDIYGLSHETLNLWWARGWSHSSLSSELWGLPESQFTTADNWRTNEWVLSSLKWLLTFSTTFSIDNFTEQKLSPLFPHIL